MRLSMKSALLLLSYVTSISCQSSYSEPTGLFNLAVAIPQSTASDDKGDIEFTFQTTLTKGWTAVGIGETMKGSLMFVIWPGSGTNVTVSPRLGTGQVLPSYYPQTNIVMRSGSGLKNGMLNAIFTCQNCKKWVGGSLNVASDTQQWMFATNPTDPIKTDNWLAPIQQHSANAYGFFAMDMTASVVADANAVAPSALPFIGGAAPNPSGTSSTVKSPILAKKNTYILAHAVMMGIAFVLLLPFGTVMIRMLRHVIRKSFYIHVLVQVGSFLLAVAALAIGVRASDLTKSHFIYSHQVFGVVVIVFLFIQVILGGAHHTLFKVKGRTWVTTAHVWFGRICIILGIINGGLGLPLAKASIGAIALYAGVSAVVTIFWLLGFAGTKFWEHKMGVNRKDDDDLTPEQKPEAFEMHSQNFNKNHQDPSGHGPPDFNLPAIYNPHQSVMYPSTAQAVPVPVPQRMSTVYNAPEIEEYQKRQAALKEQREQDYSPASMFTVGEEVESPPVHQQPFSSLGR